MAKCAPTEVGTFYAVIKRRALTTSFKKLLNCNIYALNEDEKVGNLDDILFDSDSWQIRYLVVKFRENIFKFRRVLVHTNAIETKKWNSDEIYLSLTKEQLMNEPSVDADKPVFRQMEEKYFDFYKWPYYWDDMGVFGIDPRALLETKSDHNKTDPHLHSSRIVSDYVLRQREEKIGSVADLIFSEKDWKIKSLTMKKHIYSHEEEISTEEISQIDWYDRSVHLKDSFQTSEESMTL